MKKTLAEISEFADKLDTQVKKLEEIAEMLEGATRIHFTYRDYEFEMELFVKGEFRRHQIFCPLHREIGVAVGIGPLDAFIELKRMLDLQKR